MLYVKVKVTDKIIHLQYTNYLEADFVQLCFINVL